MIAGCGPERTDDEILIGVMVPTSGDTAYFGNDMFQSYQLAVHEINAAGGVLGRQLRLFQADDGCDATMASSAAARIIAQRPDFVIGGYCSGATLATLQQYYDAGLLMLISASNSTQITEAGFSQTFMLNSPGSHAAVSLKELCQWLGAQNVALIHQGCAYSSDLASISAEVLTQHGINIATVQVMEPGAPDVSAIVTAIRNAGADFVYWCAYHADGSNVIKQLRQGGFEGHIAVGDGSASVDLITAAGPEGEGVFVTSPPFVEFSVGGERFVADYTAMFGHPPGTFATLSYDTVYVLAAAIEAAGTLEMAAVRDAVQNIEHQGLSGLIKFTPQRELAESNFIILEIRDGRFQLVNMD